MKNAKFDIAYIDLEGTDLLSTPVIDYDKFLKAFQIRNMVVITNFLINGVKQPSVQVELEKNSDDYIIFYLTHYKVVIGAEEVTVSDVQTTAELETKIETTGIDNAKPIYCHSISIDGDNDTLVSHIALLIFNNDKNAYSDYTLLSTALRAVFAVNNKAVFPITGAVYYKGTSALNIAQKIGYDDVAINVYTSRPDGTQGYFNLTSFNNLAIYDGVNKIN